MREISVTPNEHFETKKAKGYVKIFLSISCFQSQQNNYTQKKVVILRMICNGILPHPLRKNPLLFQKPQAVALLF